MMSIDNYSYVNLHSQIYKVFIRAIANLLNDKIDANQSLVQQNIDLGILHVILYKPWRTLFKRVMNNFFGSFSKLFKNI